MELCNLNTGEQGYLDSYYAYMPAVIDLGGPVTLPESYDFDTGPSGGFDDFV